MIDIEALESYAYDTIGAIHEVHKELGPGLNERKGAGWRLSFFNYKIVLSVLIVL